MIGPAKGEKITDIKLASNENKLESLCRDGYIPCGNLKIVQKTVEHEGKEWYLPMCKYEPTYLPK